ncbi:MAG: hypothetical protein HY460_02025 [Parcubacteria group bacterium]|nr:hypothetical protein [Parcubacteria group bacterium]
MVWIGMLTLFACAPPAAEGRKLAEFERVNNASIPPWAMAAFHRTIRPDTLNFFYDTNPFCQRGDFNGDGIADIAIRVVPVTQNRGILIIHGGVGDVHLVGAGNMDSDGEAARMAFGMDAWYVYERKPVERGVTAENPPTLVGEALMLVKTDASSALLYWDPFVRKYRLYWQTD